MADLTDMSDGRIQKMEVDYSSAVDEKIPECEKLAKVIYCTLKCLVTLTGGRVCSLGVKRWKTWIRFRINK